MLRGHRVLKKSGCIWKVNAVNAALTTTEFAKGREYSRLILGAGVNNAELAVRQYLLMRLAGERLGKAILYAHGKRGSAVVYPFPPEWRNVVEGHGLKVATVASTAWWNALVTVFLAYGLFSIGKGVFHGIKEIISPTRQVFGRYAFFDRLSVNNLPQPTSAGRGQDIVSWYQQWPGRVREVDAFCHTVQGAPKNMAPDVRLFYLRQAMLLPTRLTTLFRYFGWGIAASTIAVLDFLRGRWWHALILSEAAKAALMRMHQADQIARDYLFNNSAWIYRPLWTYEAEKKGSRITFYFYSTNCEMFQRAGFDPLRAYYGYRAMAWPYYLVWDKYQADFVRRIGCGNPRIDVVGPIPFSTGTVELPPLRERTVAVFDVQPMRDAFYKTLAPDFEYYTARTAIQFLSDVRDVLKEADCFFALKRKRDIGHLAHPVYRHFVEELGEQYHCTFISPSLAATKLIENCIAAISMPFTSTALLAQVSGKPSIYYDPHGQVQRDDPAAHGIEVLSGREELRRWLTSILKSQRVVDVAPA